MTLLQIKDADLRRIAERVRELHAFSTQDGFAAHESANTVKIQLEALVSRAKRDIPAGEKSDRRELGRSYTPEPLEEQGAKT